MIELYTWGTSNGRKLGIMMEELEIPYTVHPVNILENEQFSDQYKLINPNSKIPALVDSDGPDGKPITLFESGAMLIYLADKTGQFLPAEPHKRYETLVWLMFQMGGVGPMFGQVHHFKRAAKETVQYGIDRYYKECLRLYGVLNERLKAHPFLAADEYTIADIATYPWVLRYDWQEVDLDDFPHVKRWFDEISARPGVQRGLGIP